MKRVASVLLFLPCVVIIQGAIECTPNDDKCSCTASNFTLDLSFAFPDGYVNKTDPDQQVQGSSVVISPCKDFSCGGKPSRGCQWDAGSGAFNVLGTAASVMWNVNSVEDFTVTFGDGDPTFDSRVRNAQIKSMVTDKGTSVDYDGESGTGSNPLVYMFTVSAKSFTSAGGGGGEAPVGIAGLVIMILLLVGVVSYFVIGGVVMYTLKGARGVEVVPNYSFWKDLPFLIKDGFLFTFGPCVNAIRNKGTYSAL